MKIKLLLLSVISVCVILSSSSFSQTLLPPNEEKTIGQTLPNIRFLDSTGEKFNFYDFSRKPILINPIFTRCQVTCPLMTKSIRDGILELKKEGQDFHVLSLSFDVKDEIKDLALFKTEMNLPSFWKVVSAKETELFQFLDAMDFNFISQEDGGFVHPNLVLVVTPDLKISKYLYGTEFRKKTLQKALYQAQHPLSPISTFFNSYVFLFALVGFMISSCVVIFYFFNKKLK